jgi:hypothetical protein
MAGIVGSAAGAPLSQTKGSESDRAAQDAAAQQRQVSAETHAADVAGVGQTEQDEGASDRDADGRLILVESEKQRKQREDAESADADERLSKDPTGQSGSQLDLTG